MSSDRVVRPRSIFSALCLATLSLGPLGCGPSGGERNFSFADFSLIQRPAQAPPVIPSALVYPNAARVVSGLYTRTSYSSIREAVLVLESKDAPNVVAGYYYKTLEEQGWKIIQSQEEGDGVLVLAENVSRRLFTVVLRGKDPVRIKLYTRMASLR